MLDAVGLQVADAGAGDRRHPAAGQEEHAHQGQVAHALHAVGGDRLQQGDRLLLRQRRRGVLLHAGGLDGGDVLGGLPGDEPLGRELLVGAAKHRQASCDRGRFHAGLEQGALVELDVIGGDLQGSDALRLHVADEIHEVAAVGLDRVVGQQRVADPRHQCRGGTLADPPLASRARARKASTLSAAGASPSRKSLRSGTRVGRGGVAGGRAGRWESVLSFSINGTFSSTLFGTAGSSGTGVAGRPCH